jgi:hypothetical protein
MANDASEIVVAANGRVFVGPLGVTEPTDLDTAIGTVDADWAELGYINEDGVTFHDSRTLERIGAWQSFYPVRRIVTEKDAMATFVLRQWNSENVVLAFGGGFVTDEGSGVMRYTPPDPEELDERAICIEWFDDEKRYRLVMSKGIVTETSETKLARTAAADLPISFGATPASGDSAWYLLTDDPAFTATGS